MKFRKQVVITKLASDVLGNELLKYKNLNSYNKISKCKLIDYAVLKVFSPYYFELLRKERDYRVIFELYDEKNVKQ